MKKATSSNWQDSAVAMNMGSSPIVVLKILTVRKTERIRQILSLIRNPDEARWGVNPEVNSKTGVLENTRIKSFSR